MKLSVRSLLSLKRRRSKLLQRRSSDNLQLMSGMSANLKNFIVTHQSNETACKARTFAIQLIPNNEIVETISFLSFDTSSDGIMCPFLWNTSSEGDWYEKSFSSALLIHIVWNFALLFPFFGFSCDVLGSS